MRTCEVVDFFTVLELVHVVEQEAVHLPVHPIGVVPLRRHTCHYVERVLIGKCIVEGEVVIPQIGEVPVR